MASRVLTTQEAKDAIMQFRTVVDGSLRGEVQKLNQHGSTLSQPNVWDGPLAIQFRELWSKTSTSLQTLLSDLDELHSKLAQIQTNIMQAGGG